MEEIRNNAPETESKYLIEVKNLVKWFPIKSSFFKRTIGNVRAVDGISFHIKRGQTMGLVGESGCGKSTAGRTILRLIEKTSGEVLFDGQDIFKMSREELRRLRPRIQIIFQDPYSSLSPRIPVGEIIGEAVREHNIVPKEEFDDYISRIMRACGLQEYHKDRYPHEFSGGQRQRICIARALALNPDFIVCDEPVSALDVSIQAQIINLLKQLQKDFGFTYLFISHDLSVVEHISDTVGVMYLGSMVEYADTDKIFAHPLHPYTEALFSAIPIPDPDVKMKRIILKGSLPSPANPPRAASSTRAATSAWRSANTPCRSGRRSSRSTGAPVTSTTTRSARRARSRQWLRPRAANPLRRMSRKKRYEDDDGRVVARMNVEGMPWYAERGENVPEQTEQSGGPEPMTKEESRAFAWGAVKAALLVTAVFSVGAVLFILFCTEIWFR